MVSRFFKNLIIEIWKNPKEGLLLILILSGGFISALFGAICFGAEECGKKVLDMVKKG
jgi:hypothetical protein